MSSSTIKRNDLNVLFTDTLKVGGVPADLSGCTVSFILRNRSTGTTLKRAATIVSAIAGTVSYAPTAPDTETEGTYDQEWEVIFPGSKPLSFPTRGFNTIEILPDLA